MCGICGIVSLDHSAGVDTQSLKRMNDALKLRGPDDEGYHTDRGVGLAMRRLSIIDLEGGHQPISNETGTKWIVCNGEIYSSVSLRSSLQHHGHTFRTHSDVEVILHAYEEYGVDFVRFLNGMFAFAIWDSDEQKLILGRDRTGIKPLYYTLHNNTLLFSSELRSLLAHEGVSKNIDFISLDQYLTFEYVPSPRSIIKNVFKLPPGHILEFSVRGGLSVRQYWDFSFEKSESRPPLNCNELADQFIDTLKTSVGLEMLSDVPLGVFLSGGLDSSSVAAMAMRISKDPIKTFTLQFDDASFDESYYADIVARHIGSDHHVKRVNHAEILDTINLIPKIIDEPLGDSSIVPTYILSKFAREHVKVVLGGDGGDELFAGYPTLKAHRLVEWYERLVPHVLRSSILPKIVSSLPVSFNNISFDFKARRFLSGRGVPMGIRHHNWLGSFTDSEKARLLHPDLHYRELDGYHILTDHSRRCDATNPYNQILYWDMKLYLEGDILFKVDRASMASSLEARVPLLNLAMLRFAETLPISYKLRRFEGKYLMKKAMLKLLPREIVYRKKKGFNIPVGKLMQGELKPMLLDYLSSDRLKRQGFFNHKEVTRLIDDHLKSRADNRKQLWTLLMFQRWFERYMENEVGKNKVEDHLIAA